MEEKKENVEFSEIENNNKSEKKSFWKKFADGAKKVGRGALKVAPAAIGLGLGFLAGRYMTREDREHARAQKEYLSKRDNKF